MEVSLLAAPAPVCGLCGGKIEAGPRTRLSSRSSHRYARHITKHSSGKFCIQHLERRERPSWAVVSFVSSQRPNLGFCVASQMAAKLHDESLYYENWMRKHDCRLWKSQQGTVGRPNEALLSRCCSRVHVVIPGQITKLLARLSTSGGIARPSIIETGPLQHIESILSLA